MGDGYEQACIIVKVTSHMVIQVDFDTRKNWKKFYKLIQSICLSSNINVKKLSVETADVHCNFI